MNKNKKIWIGVISLGLALLLFGVLLMIQKSMMEEPVCERVVCAKTAIPANVVLTKDNLSTYVEEKEIPVMYLPEGYITSEEVLKGMVAEGEISQGSILCKATFTPHEAYYDSYQELTWISVPINQLFEGVAGSLRAGDYIDIYLLRKEEGEEQEQFVCELMAERVRIEATYTSQGEGIGAESVTGLSQLVVIPMERGNTAQFYEKLAQGNIRIAKYEAG